MSSSFIGSQIAIITKSQCRYVGTIIGIDSNASSILLGNVKCFGTENRGGNFSNKQMAGTIVPIMQFANSDIEDLKIVGEEQQQQQQTETPSSRPMPIQSPAPAPAPAPSAPVVSKRQPSIHDDPAIVSAVVSTSNKDLSVSSRLIQDLHRMNLSDEQSKRLPKPEESRLHTDSGELGSSWLSSPSSKWDNNKSSSQQQQQQPSSMHNRSKFFDDFTLNNSEPVSSNRSQPPPRWPSHSTSARHQIFNEHEDESILPVRQPFFSNDQSFQSNRQQNGYQQRSFYNNRRGQMNNQGRRPVGTGGGNRETFHDNGNFYDDDFDFETSNRKFNKLASEDEYKQHSESPNQFLFSNNDPGHSSDYQPLYDKKKSFFDNVTLEDTSDVLAPMYNRSRNHDTFGNSRYQRGYNRANNAGYRRPNYNNNNNNNSYRQQQQGNEDFYYRQNNNGYHYRY